MSTKMVRYWKDKEVLVTVYVERPTRKRPNIDISRDHTTHHHIGKGYNRRAELLLYSQRLRRDAQPAMVVAEPSSVEPKKKPTSPIICQAKDNIVAVGTKPTLSRTTCTPACMGNWKTFMPAFLRCLTSVQSKKQQKKNNQAGSTSNGMKAVKKSLDTEMPKKKGFISKLLSAMSNWKDSM